MFVDLSTSIVSTTKDQWNESTNRWTGMYAMRAYTCIHRDVAAMSVIPCSQIYMRNSATVQFRHLCIAVVSTLCIWVTWKKLFPRRETPSNSTHPMEYQLYFCANPNRDRYKSSFPTKIYFPYKHADASFALGLFLWFRSFHVNFIWSLYSVLYVRTWRLRLYKIITILRFGLL